MGGERRRRRRILFLLRLVSRTGSVFFYVGALGYSRFAATFHKEDARTIASRAIGGLFRNASFYDENFHVSRFNGASYRKPSHYRIDMSGKYRLREISLLSIYKSVIGCLFYSLLYFASSRIVFLLHLKVSCITSQSIRFICDFLFSAITEARMSNSLSLMRVYNLYKSIIIANIYNKHF